MADEIDRDQEFNEQQLEKLINQHRFKAGASSSLLYCRRCGEQIAERRRITLTGITTCIDCQLELEQTQTR